MPSVRMMRSDANECLHSHRTFSNVLRRCLDAGVCTRKDLYVRASRSPHHIHMDTCSFQYSNSQSCGLSVLLVLLWWWFVTVQCGRCFFTYFFFIQFIHNVSASLREIVVTTRECWFNKAQVVSKVWQTDHAAADVERRCAIVWRMCVSVCVSVCLSVFVCRYVSV